MTAAIVADGLGKRYGRRWALQNCSVEVPQGRVVGLVGPNGAGKSTFLNLAAGLLTPSVGRLSVLDGVPGASPEQLAKVGFVAQDTPTYAGLSVGDHLRLGAHMNNAWDDDLAHRRIRELGLDARQRAGKLSGGQKAQLALTVAIAKRPQLLLLDEPVASLDPLARRDFLSTVMAVVADQGVNVMLSSHLVADLERVCDYLVVLVESRVALSGEVDDLLASHRRLVGPRCDPSTLPSSQTVIEESHTDRQSTLLIRTDEPVHDPAWNVEEVGLEDIVLAYMSQKLARQPPSEVAVGGDLVTWVAWRQFRTSAIAAGAALLVVAVLLALTTIDKSSGCALAVCVPNDGHLGRLTHDNVLSILSTMLVAFPAVIGVFWGSPLVAREIENGTYRLAWTQSVSRTRWLATRLLIVGGGSAAACGLFSAMLAWWSSASVERDRLAPSMFGERGITPIAYAVFALALGVAAGVLIRRTLPAMVTTLVGFIGVRMVMQFLVRAHLLPVRHFTAAINANSAVGISLNASSGAFSLAVPSVTSSKGWVVSTRIVDGSGHSPTAAFLAQACRRAKTLAGGPPPGGPPAVSAGRGAHQAPPAAVQAFQSCLSNVGKRYHETVAYQPNSHYWGLQLLETAIFLGLAVVLLGFAFRSVRRRLT